MATGPMQLGLRLTRTPTVCRIIASFGFRAILLPILRGLRLRVKAGPPLQSA